MRSRFLDKAIFHRDLRSWKIPEWKMAAAQELQAFQGFQRAMENHYFPHLTLGSVSIVILRIFYVENHDGKSL